MLRTLLISGFVLAATASYAAAEPFRSLVQQIPESPVGLEVRSDDGTLLSRTTQVERNAAGRIVAADAPGLEPADAPRAPSNLVASRDQGFVPAAWRRAPTRDAIGGATRTR